MNMHFQEKYRVELADRELWITKMNVSPQIESWDRKIWKEHVRVIHQEFERTASIRPFQYFGLFLSTYLQPISVYWQRLRRRAAIKKRFKFLFR